LTAKARGAYAVIPGRRKAANPESRSALILSANLEIPDRRAARAVRNDDQH